MADQQVFSLDKDSFGGITIDTKKVTFSSAEDFAAKLKASITRWREEEVRGLWVKIHKQHSFVIPACVEEGFEFHHAQPGYVLMKTWLPTDEKDMLPSYANQYLGSAGFVINEAGQVLVVKEKFSQRPQWKLPGGMSDAGEDIGEAARREVFEETGIKAEFVSILAFRHQHNFRHGCSDLYFVSLMKAKTTEIKPCRQEIAECCWMDVDEYMAQDISEANLYFAKKYKDLVESDGPSLRSESVLSYNKKTRNQVYSIHRVKEGERKDP